MAAAAQRDEIAVLDQLEQTDSVRSERAAPLTDLADALTDSGDYAGARRAYEQGLEIVKAMGDERTEGVVLGQLGTLAMREGRLGEAEGRYREALAIKETLDPGAAEIWTTHEIIPESPSARPTRRRTRPSTQPGAPTPATSAAAPAQHCSRSPVPASASSSTCRWTAPSSPPPARPSPRRPRHPRPALSPTPGYAGFSRPPAAPAFQPAVLVNQGCPSARARLNRA